MLFNLLFPMADQFSPFNLFRYITFRTGGAVLTALVISFVVGPALIRWLRARQGEGQPIRADGPPSHLLRKRGTPTMGGTLILLALTLATLLWADLSNGYVWVVLLITLGFGAIGLVDDWTKLTKRSSHGISARLKLLLQTADRAARGDLHRVADGRTAGHGPHHPVLQGRAGAAARACSSRSRRWSWSARRTRSTSPTGWTASRSCRP